MSENKEELIQTVLTRGVEHVYPSREALEAALRGNKKLTLYCGYDPNAPTLHIGHGITIRKLAQFQKLGHKVIFLFGDFTGQIGDPDKLSARQQITHAQVKKNLSGWKKQISRLINAKKITFKFNSKWLAKLTFKDLIEIAQHFTAQQMLDRDMFKERMKIDRPIYLHEFFYPLMQAYDSVAMNVDLELGGNDQTFNMLAGRTLMKAMKGKEKFVLTMKLLEDPTGKKMGKSEGNMITLSDEPTDMYGKVMSWPDTMIASSFEILTDVPMAEIQQITQQLANGENPKNFKMRLAHEVVTIYCGAASADKAQAQFTQVFSEGMKPGDIETKKSRATSITEVLVETGLATSLSEARRLIGQGGIRINDEKVTDVNQVVAKGSVIQKGKRYFIRVE